MLGRSRLCLLSSISLVAVSAASQADAQQPSGTTVRADKVASAAGQVGARTLEINGPVFMGDEITTDSNGVAQIRFVDDTKIVVGPNSRLAIDAFVFNPNATAQEVTIRFTKGALRFISGQSPSQVYSVLTPTMTIGMRGTGFDCAVSNDDRTLCAAIEGTITACDRDNLCADFTADCSIVSTTPGGDLGTIPPGFGSAQVIASYFPFIGDQDQLEAAFRLDTSSCSRVNPRFMEQPSDSLGDSSTDRPSFESDKDGGGGYGEF